MEIDFSRKKSRDIGTFIVPDLTKQKIDCSYLWVE